ncbi:MAG TPA: heme-degrading domain-containing protein [Actinocrinis sp.]
MTAQSTAQSAAAATSAEGEPEAALAARLEQQEHRLQLDGFDNDDAWRLGCLLVELARERGHAVTIDVRRGDHQLFHCALPGTAPDNDTWIERKVRVVRRFEHSSLLVGQRHRDKGTTFEAATPHLDPALYAAHGGSFPIRVRGVGVVGTVTVSGLPQTEDHALVVEGLESYLGDK